MHLTFLLGGIHSSGIYISFWTCSPSYLDAVQIWSFVLNNWIKCLNYSSEIVWYQNVHVRVTHLRPLIPLMHFQGGKKRGGNLHFCTVLWFQPSRHGGRQHSNNWADRWCINYLHIKLCERNTYWIVLPLKIWHFTKHLNQNHLSLIYSYQNHHRLQAKADLYI